MRGDTLRIKEMVRGLAQGNGEGPRSLSPSLPLFTSSSVLMIV